MLTRDVRWLAGKEEEVVRKDVGRNRYFTPEEAIEYGIIDRIVRPQESVRSALGPHSIFQQLFAVQLWVTGVPGYVACCATFFWLCFSSCTSTGRLKWAENPLR